MDTQPPDRQTSWFRAMRGAARRRPSELETERMRWALTIAMGLIVAAQLLDMRLDAHAQRSWVHDLSEFAPSVVAVFAIGLIWRDWLRVRLSLDRAQGDLARERQARELWRRRADRLLQGLGAEIDAQFDRWGLSPAERETALLLLKGFGHKEIASLLGKSERTVRQQAGAVYAKAGLSGRAELSAFFLEDLLLPSRELREAGHRTRGEAGGQAKAAPHR